MASMVTAPPLSSRPPPDPPPFPSHDTSRLERSSPPLLHIRLDLHPLKQLLPSLIMMVTAPLCPLVSLSPVTPPEPPDPPDMSVVALLRLLNTFSSLSLAMFGNSDLEFPSPMLDSRGCNSLLLFSSVSSSIYGCLFSRPSPQVFTQISTLKPPSMMATKNGDGLPVSTSDVCLAYGLYFPVVYRSLFGCVYDTSFAYGLLSPVVYRTLMECVDWSSISSCFDLSTTPPCKVLHAHLSSLLYTYSAMVEWFRQLFVWVMLELRFMFLADDILMGLVSFGSTFATSSSFYIALQRSSAVCSSLTSSNSDGGVVFVYLSSWWHVEEKLIVIFIPMNMDVALVPRLNQSSFLIYPPIWSELDVQVSLVLQGSSSHRMLSSAYGAVCVVLRVTLDAIFEDAYDVVIQFFMALLVICIAILSFMLLLFVCLAGYSLFVSSFIGV